MPEEGNEIGKGIATLALVLGALGLLYILYLDGEVPMGEAAGWTGAITVCIIGALWKL